MKKYDKKPAQDSELREKLKRELGLNSAELNVENRIEILMPKMAILGFIESMIQFLQSAKDIIGASPKLNTNALRILLNYISQSIKITTSTISHYEKIHTVLLLQETLKGPQSPLLPNDDDDDDGTQEQEDQQEEDLKHLASSELDDDDIDEGEHSKLDQKEPAGKSSPSDSFLSPTQNKKTNLN